jgi:hypothetical protein
MRRGSGSWVSVDVHARGFASNLRCAGLWFCWAMTKRSCAGIIREREGAGNFCQGNLKDSEGQSGLSLVDHYFCQREHRSGKCGGNRGGSGSTPWILRMYISGSIQSFTLCSAHSTNMALALHSAVDGIRRSEWRLARFPCFRNPQDIKKRNIRPAFIASTHISLRPRCQMLITGEAAVKDFIVVQLF